MIAILLHRRKKNTRLGAATIEELHGKYGALIYDICFRMLGNSSDAEDSVQETFMNAHRSLESFRYGETHLPWLCRIATNVCLKAIHKKNRDPTVCFDTLLDTEWEESDPVRKIHARRVLRAFFDDLDERNQQILLAKYLTGMKQEKIAESLHVSRRTVVKRLAAIRRRAHSMLEEVEND